jgi:hypothetical protein
MKYFSYDTEGDGFTLHATADEAKAAADNDIACYRAFACEGWLDSIQHVCWGELKQMAFMVNEMTKQEAEHQGIYFDNSFDTICDYEIRDV